MAKELLEQVLGNEGHGHKDMAGIIINLDQFKTELEEYGCRLDIDPTKEGGFIFANGGNPIAYIRSPYWRTEVNDPDLRVTDIRPVFIQPKESSNLEEIQTGAEFEMFAWDPIKSEAAPIMAHDSPFPYWLEKRNNGNGFIEEDTIFPELDEHAKKIGFSDEFIKSCIELNFHHSSDPIETAMSMARALKTLAQGVEQQGWLLIPTASFPSKPLCPDDTNQNPYVQRIAMDYMGWENVRHFIGSSWQVHVEMVDLESALKAINLYQQISPLLYGLSLAGPFAHGQVNPNLKDIYLEDENNQERLSDTQTYEALDNNNWLSIRLPARWRGSPSGGVYIIPAPEDQESFCALAELGLKDNNHDSTGNIPSPARAMGHHRDRIRVDIPNNGTLEISNQDTYGGNILKLAANQEFTRVLIWKLQVYAKEGKLNELTQAYPTLFSYPVTPESLRQTHLDSIEIAKKGMDSDIYGADGKKYYARNLFNRLLEFVNEPLFIPDEVINFQGLPPGVNTELYNSSLNPEDIFEIYHDSQGITSTRGFYKSGFGTLSHWLKRRAKELMSQDLSSEEAIKDCMNDLGLSYHEHLAKINGQDIINLFS
ncbi:hypothetical protein A2863_02455 [Candidatus Woesebacteria bacterium RIFCSPHIGHO2_01_FULL_38_9b]|uniref:Glutamate--cysteine ligase n=1 Tax=Candidatus Woesebacteria bacterium RIFCSPHIGHO2_01_FULL_38_9b TaxID=1802493 RepID=A0A1F7Y0J0_9BACT|nr:MAG: hypothetical protein A2863_02455 [Candidatus Woesebacteria bacterium RIFCSPHIGHO2_01_FULL_38_9b]